MTRSCRLSDTPLTGNRLAVFTDARGLESELRAECGDGLIDRVEVGGCAVVVARGEFRL